MADNTGRNTRWNESAYFFGALQSQSDALTRFVYTSKRIDTYVDISMTVMEK